jgi:NADH-quinone oxidoreductase subunit L
LVLLSIPAVLAGYWFGFYSYVNVTSTPVENLSFTSLVADPFTWLGVIVSFVGLGVAWGIYGRIEFVKIHAFVESSPFLRILHRILYNRYYVDTLYNWITSYIMLGLATLAQAFDQIIVDGIVNGVARIITSIGTDVRHVETGRVQSYMVGFFSGVAVLVVLAIVLVFTVGK